MTAFTAPTVSAVGELALVHILVAVGTVSKRYFRFLFPAAMAFCTVYTRMRTTQRKTGEGVVEGAGIYLLPTRRAMTFLAVLPEFSAMHVAVTGRAVFERQADVFCEGLGTSGTAIPLRNAGMALGARHILMLPRESELRPLVVKFCRGLPAGEIVALQALFRQLPSMLVLVAAQAIL